MRTIAAIAAALLFSLTIAYVSKAAANAPPAISPGSLVISEIQTGGCADNAQPVCNEDTKKEFVELYNQHTEPLNVHGWKVEYVSASGNTVTTLAALNGVVAGHSSVLIAHAGYYTAIADLYFGDGTDTGKLAKSGGHIQVLDGQNAIRDLVGWGSAARPLTKAAKYPDAGLSIQRIAGALGFLTNSGDNFSDFSIPGTPDPLGGGYQADPPAVTLPAPVPTPTPGDPVSPAPDGSQLTCEGVVISEILVNPAGTDTGKEFIELRNPTDEVIPLAGCSLQTSASAKTYSFADTGLQPGEYRSFSDAETGLTLPNAAGGTVWLLSPTAELHVLTYPANLPDDTAWALVDGNWIKTYTPTPDRPNIWTAGEPCPANQERNPETNRCVTTAATSADPGAAAASTLTACKPGQTRNPETNRCRAAAAADTELIPCKAGQTRNPATNRCAAAATNAASGNLAACKAGQVRNPDTNRCRAIAAASTAVKPCLPGQERNPDTGRCRKSTAASGGLAQVEDVKTPPGTGNTRWLIAGLAIIAAIAYGVYEWRQEVLQKLRRIFGRTSRRLSPFDSDPPKAAPMTRSVHYTHTAQNHPAGNI